MAGLNQRRRKAAQAKQEANAERNRLHPAIPSSRDRLSTSPAHADALMGASHNVGFMGQGRSVANPTRVISAKLSADKSRVDMSATSNFGRVEEPRTLGYTAPKSARFRDDEYPSDKPTRGSNMTETRKGPPGRWLKLEDGRMYQEVKGKFKRL